jgi:heptosyltransferase-2
MTARDDNLQRILVVKLADIGDLLTATPALRALRRRFPEVEITALVTPHTACLLDGNDAVDNTLLFPKAVFDDPRDLARPWSAVRALTLVGRLAAVLRRRRFDAIVLLHHLTTRWGTSKYRALALASGAPVRLGLDNGSGSFLTHRAKDRGFGARHEVDYWLDTVAVLGATDAPNGMELHLTEDELSAAERRWSELGLEGRPVVAVHPGGGVFSVAKRWPPARFAAVADALASDGMAVTVVGGPQEGSLVSQVRGSMAMPSVPLVGMRSPRELAATLARCSLFVGNDSGVMHCAATMGVPVVGVFGLSNHRAWGPYPPERHRVVRLDLPCSPCLYHAFSLGTPQGCLPRMCLSELTPDPVIAAARELRDTLATLALRPVVTAGSHGVG